MYVTPANKEAASWKRQRIARGKRKSKLASPPAKPTTASMEQILAHMRHLHEQQPGASGSHSAFPGGFVYVMSNPAWSEVVKIGKAIDYEERKEQFNTTVPYRDYVIEYVVPVTDRDRAEKMVHDAIDALRVDGEWFRIEVARAIMVVFETTKPLRFQLGS